MKSRSPAMRVPMALTAFLAVLLIALSAVPASADPKPGPTTLTASVETRADFLVAIVGTLTDQAGSPIPDSAIFAQVNGDEVAEGVTNEDGDYVIEFTAAEDLRSEDQPLVVFFEGRDGLDASQTDTAVVPPLTEARIGATLTATTASSNVSSGGLVIIDGTLVDAAGAPVSGVGISVMLDDNESADSLVMTDESGVFQTFAEVPSNQPTGEASLVVSFAGDESYKAAQQAIGLVVEQIPLANASPTASPTTTDSAGASTSVDPTMVNTDKDASAKASKDGDRSPFSWFYVALVVVGGAALLIAAGLVFRGMYGRSGEAVSRRAGSLDTLLELAEEDEASAPLENSAPESELSGSVDADPGEDAGPRRGVE